MNSVLLLPLHFGPLLIEPLGRDGDARAEFLREEGDAQLFDHPAE